MSAEDRLGEKALAWLHAEAVWQRDQLHPDDPDAAGVSGTGTEAMPEQCDECETTGSNCAEHRFAGTGTEASDA